MIFQGSDVGALKDEWLQLYNNTSCKVIIGGLNILQQKKQLLLFLWRNFCNIPNFSKILTRASQLNVSTAKFLLI